MTPIREGEPAPAYSLSRPTTRMRHQMMERRMDMMQTMMEEMLERVKAQSGEQ